MSCDLRLWSQARKEDEGFVTFQTYQRHISHGIFISWRFLTRLKCYNVHVSITGNNCHNLLYIFYLKTHNQPQSLDTPSNANRKHRIYSVIVQALFVSLSFFCNTKVRVVVFAKSNTDSGLYRNINCNVPFSCKLYSWILN